MNKYKIITLVLLLSIILSISKVYAIVNGYSLLGKIIYIDPGHGGIDSGAIYNGIEEKNINLILAKKLEQSLIAKGATVYLTREIDKDLSTTSKNRKRSDLYNRAQLINNANPDLYISIHLNYISNSKWQGLQIFYNNKNSENKNIAVLLTEYLKEKTNNVREIKYANSYYMYNNIKTPGVLIEVGFLSNSNDRYRLTHNEYQNIIINNLSFSINKYFTKKD